jgi:hypothetical protein
MTAGAWLQAQRKAAGFATAVGLARAIQAPAAQARAWERGEYKPPWRFIDPLAIALDVSRDDVLAELWGEAIGDACACGVPGCVKVEPDEPMARALRSGRTCAQCGAVRVYSSDVARRDHADRCDDCSKATARAPRIMQRCAGYVDHERRRRAPTCRGERSLREAHFRRLINRPKGERVHWGAGAVVLDAERILPALALRPGGDPNDPAAWDWTCPPCRLAAMAIAVAEQRINDPAAEPVREPTRIRSATHRRAILRDSEQGAADGLARELTPEFFAAGQRARKAANAARADGLTPEGTARRLRSMIVHHWSRDPLPRVIVFECRGCGGIAFCEERMLHQGRGRFVRTAEWHSACQPGPGRRPAPDRPAHRPAKKDRRREFAWAIQLRAGGASVREIANRYGVHRSTVDEAIRKIQAVIEATSPALIPARFRPHVEIIMGDRS